MGILGRLGFARVTNRNRDFYADVAALRVPAFDVLVTNPPYRCCFEGKRERLRRRLAPALSPVRSAERILAEAAVSVLSVTVSVLILQRHAQGQDT